MIANIFIVIRSARRGDETTEASKGRAALQKCPPEAGAHHDQPPLPPFFFFGACFLRVAPEDDGFCCRGGTAADGAADAPEPGRGEVGGLLAILLASLSREEKT